MTITRVGTPAFVTQAGTSLSQSLTCAGDADVYLLVTQRGGSGSPTSVTLGGVTASAAGGLFQITGSARYGRWYRIERDDSPASGSRTCAVSWAGVDNIGVGMMEYRGDAGTLSVTQNVEASNASTPITLTLTALTGDVTLAGCMGNSAAPAFSPSSGQTELLESAWFSNTGHVIGELFGASSSIAWTASGSTCGGALVIHETASGGTTVDATGSGASVAVAAGQGVASVSVAATGSGIGAAVAAGQAVASVQVAATGSGIGIEVASGQATVSATATATGSGASLAMAAGQGVAAVSVTATGSGAALAVEAGQATADTGGTTVQATGSGIGIAVAAGSVTLSATVAAQGSAISIAVADGQAFIPGDHTVAPARRTAYDSPERRIFADVAEVRRSYDSSESRVFADGG
jgi:hypothetical protein